MQFCKYTADQVRAMTPDELVVAAVGGLLEQGVFATRRAGDGGLVCAYRIREGDRVVACVAGQVLPDSQRDLETNETAGAVEIPLFRSMGTEATYHLCALQRLHDSEARDTRPSMRKFFREVRSVFSRITFPSHFQTLADAADRRSGAVA